jgi:small subunit ribosomal protein S10
MIRIKLKSYDNKLIDTSCREIIDILKRFDADYKGPIPLPTEIKKITVNRAPFIYKDSREQFEIRIHKRIIDVMKTTPQIFSALKDISIPAGVEIEIKII